MVFWDRGFNFRATAGFVTDGPVSTYVIGDTYPTTRNGVTFGWESGFQAGNVRNRNASIDVQLAGINFCPSGQQGIFRVDLPATGNFAFYLANGDAGSSQQAQYWEIRDNNTVLFSFQDDDGTASGHFNDANGVDLTTVTWPTNTSEHPLTFSSTIFRLALAKPTALGSSHVIANLYIYGDINANQLFVYTPKSSGTVTVSWNANTEPDLAGYKVYYGTQSGVYTTNVNVGNVTSTIITGLAANITYYFAVTAYDTSSNESGFSSEVSLLVITVLQTGGSALTSTGHDYNYVGTGSAITGGAAAKSRRRVFVVSGGLIAGGSAVTSVKGGGKFTYAGSGGMVTSGTITFSRRVVPTIGGTITMGGAAQTVYAAARKIFIYPGGGQALTSGASTNSKRKTAVVSGGMTMAGAATSVFTVVQKQIFSYVGAGVMTTSGTSTVTMRQFYVATGGLITGGAAGVFSFIQTRAFTYQATGSATITGASANLKKKVATATGGTVATGSAPSSLELTTLNQFFYTASGQATTAGAGSISRVQLYLADGGSNSLGGAATSYSASVLQAFTYAGSGVASTSGAATVINAEVYSATGGVVASGSAPSSLFQNARTIYEYTATGAAATTGAAALLVVQTYDATGGAVGAGGAVSSVITFGVGGSVFQYSPTGEMVLSGTPGLQVVMVYDPTGEIVMGGDPGAPGYVFEPNPECPPFRVFKVDCELEIKGWAEVTAYDRVKPFGGQHQDPPSGAEI